MEKIIITKKQYNKLTNLSELLPLKDKENLQKNTAENVMSAKYQTDEMIERLNLISEALFDFESAIYDHDPEEMLNQMEQYVKGAKELEKDLNLLRDYLAGSLIRFSETVAPSDFTVIVPEAEIRATIDREFGEDNVMSLGYKDGEFALLFGEDENTLIPEPFIFAKGREECYEEARRYIETFLDMEE